MGAQSFFSSNFIPFHAIIIKYIVSTCLLFMICALFFFFNPAWDTNVGGFVEKDKSGYVMGDCVYSSSGDQQLRYICTRCLCLSVAY